MGQRNRNRRRGPIVNADKAVDSIMRLGYYVEQFSPYHFRFEDSVDFWPTRLTWRAPKGYGFDNHGSSLVTLKAYLTQYHALPEDRRP